MRRSAPASGFPRALPLALVLKLKFTLALVLAALILATACEIDRNAYADLAVRDSAGITIIENDSLPARASAVGAGVWEVDPVPRVEIGGDDSGPASDLFRISAVTTTGNGGLVVADGAARLLFFDRDGVYVRTVGREGDGPGEFRNIDWVQRTAADSLVVYDARSRRATVLDAQGGHARTIGPESTSGEGPPLPLVGAFPDGTLLSMRRTLAASPPGGAGIVRSDFILSRHAPDGALRDSLTAVPSDEVAVVQGIVIPHADLRRTHFAIAGQELYLTSSDAFDVRHHDAAGRLVRIVRKAHRPLLLTDADREEFTFPARVEIDPPEAFPAIIAMLPDAEGNLWVEAFRRDRDEEGRWFVFDADGRLTASVLMPPRFRPMHIGDDFVAGVWKNNLDVEHVRLHALAKGR